MGRPLTVARSRMNRMAATVLRMRPRVLELKQATVCLLIQPGAARGANAVQRHLGIGWGVL